MPCNKTFRPATAVQTVDYPPVAARARFSDEAQRETLFEIGEALAIRFDLERRRPQPALSFAVPIYYEEGNPAVRVVPDFFVSPASNGKRRQTYKLWEEPKAPDFVLDVAAAAADRDRDWRGKPGGYAAIGVPEYWRFDPTGQHFEPRLQGFRRQADGYVALPANREGSAITIRSEALDLDLHFDGERLRLRDSQTGRFFPTGREFFADAVAAEAAYYAELDALRKADAKLEAETQALRKADAELEAETQALRKADAELEAETEALRKADAELEAETQALRQAEARVARAEKRLLARGLTPRAKPYDTDTPTRRRARSSFG